MMNDIKLKECPFCGGKAVWCATESEEELHECHFIICTGCGFLLELDSDEANQTHDMGHLVYLTAQAWNRRADDPIVYPDGAYWVTYNGWRQATNLINGNQTVMVMVKTDCDWEFYDVLIHECSDIVRIEE
jgi:hypothetical protein